MLAAVLLTGCAVDTQDPVEPSETAPDPVPRPQIVERDVPVRLTADSEVGPPVWEVGTAFGQHYYYGSNDTEGRHVTTVVVDDTGPSYVLAATDQRLAREEAMWDLPLVGTYDKETLATTAFGADWDWWFDFPLYDGKTWSRDLRLPDLFDGPSVLGVDFKVRYDPDIVSNGKKTAGFHITGTTSEDFLLFAYDYVPAIGWYDHFYWYDVFGDDPERWLFHGMSMGVQKDWSGTYYIDEARQVLDYESIVYPDPIDLEMEPRPTATFNVSEEAAYLMGSVYSFAYLGHNSVVLVTPSDEMRTYDATHTEFDPTLSRWPDGEHTAIDEAAEAGEWRVLHVGAAVSQIARVDLHEIIENRYEIAPSGGQ